MTRAKQDLIEANWRPSERFAHEWLSGYLDLPVRPCTNEQLYEAFTAWAARNGERWPPSQSLFSGQINRWANEQRRRDPATGRLQDARLVYKVITVDPPTRQRKSRRCFLPAGTGPADGSGQTEGQWMHECIEEFDALLVRSAAAVVAMRWRRERWAAAFRYVVDSLALRAKWLSLLAFRRYAASHARACVRGLSVLDLVLFSCHGPCRNGVSRVTTGT